MAKTKLISKIKLKKQQKTEDYSEPTNQSKEGKEMQIESQEPPTEVKEASIKEPRSVKQKTVKKSELKQITVDTDLKSNTEKTEKTKNTRLSKHSNNANNEPKKSKFSSEPSSNQNKTTLSNISQPEEEPKKYNNPLSNLTTFNPLSFLSHSSQTTLPTSNTVSNNALTQNPIISNSQISTSFPNLNSLATNTNTSITASNLLNSVPLTNTYSSQIPKNNLSSLLSNTKMKNRKLVFPEPPNSSINFVGLIIGPKGIFLRTLEELSKCKIKVRGIGTCKNPDSAKESELEPTHAIMESENDDCLNKAQMLIQRVLMASEDVIGRIKDEQHRINKCIPPDQANTVILNAKLLGFDSATMRLLLANSDEHTRNVLGYDNSNISSSTNGNNSSLSNMHLQNMSNISNISNLQNFSNISRGQTGQNLDFSLNTINNISNSGINSSINNTNFNSNNTNISSSENNIYPDQFLSLNTTNSSSIYNVPTEELHLTSPYGKPSPTAKIVPVPNDCVGLLIGKGGETIKKLIKESNCRILIALKEIPNTQTRNIFIEGDNYEVAKKLIEDIVAHQLKVQLNMSHIGEVNNFRWPYVLLKIPSEYAGLVIGKSGDQVKTILAETGCAIFVPNKNRVYYEEMVRLLKQLGDSESILFSANNKPHLPWEEWGGSSNNQVGNLEKGNVEGKEDGGLNINLVGMGEGSEEDCNVSGGTGVKKPIETPEEVPCELVTFSYNRDKILKFCRATDYREITTKFKKNEPYRILELSGTDEAVAKAINRVEKIIENHEERLTSGNNKSNSLNHLKPNYTSNKQVPSNQNPQQNNNQNLSNFQHPQQINNYIKPESTNSSGTNYIYPMYNYPVYQHHYPGVQGVNMPNIPNHQLNISGIHSQSGPNMHSMSHVPNLSTTNMSSGSNVVHGLPNINNLSSIPNMHMPSVPGVQVVPGFNYGYHGLVPGTSVPNNSMLPPNNNTGGNLNTNNPNNNTNLNSNNLVYRTPNSHNYTPNTTGYYTKKKTPQPNPQVQSKQYLDFVTSYAMNESIRENLINSNSSGSSFNNNMYYGTNSSGQPNPNSGNIQQGGNQNQKK